MGAACCIAAKDRTITNGSPVETLQRHSRNSPTWSFRWDNRGRVAEEETPANWLHNDGGAKTGTSVETVFASEEGSPLDSFRSLAWHKSPVSERNGGVSMPQSSDQAISQNIVEVKESRGSPTVSYPSPMKLSPSVPSVSSTSASPLSSQSHLLHPNSTPSRWHNHRSPRHRLLRQVSDSRIIPEYKSPTFSICEGNESSTRGSNGGSSDSWSIPLATTRRERWSFDSESFTRSSELNFRSPSFELQTCGICTKLLIERSKIMSANDLAVVSVLTCGHVYHGECLETMTPEIDKYDPACPICTFGEKRAVKMSEKVLKSELDSKARKKFRKRAVVDSDVSGDVRYRKSGVDPKMCSSSSMKSSSSSIGKPFLKRHFSFGSKTSRSFSDNQSTPRKGFFWARSSKN
ncbi:hypothetical protein ABFS83_02G020400 [Erythranthe nasuta]